MKLPFDLSLKFLFRSGLPGMVLTLGFAPLIQCMAESLRMRIPIESVLIASALILGWLVIVFDTHIYMLFEGRRYWPAWLREWGLERERARLQRLMTIKDTHKNSQCPNQKRMYREASVELRRFPMDESGEYTVTHPTRLGNLLAAFEEYPLRVYGMSSAFYWYRVWWHIDKDVRGEIDEHQALADSTLYCSLALVITGLVTVVYATVQALDLAALSYLPETKSLAFAGVLTILAAWGLYRASLHLHAQFGEMFKGIFDVFGQKVDVEPIITELIRLSGNNSLRFSPRKEKRIIAWRYLHNYRFKDKAGTIVKPPELERMLGPEPPTGV